MTPTRKHAKRIFLGKTPLALITYPSIQVLWKRTPAREVSVSRQVDAVDRT